MAPAETDFFFFAALVAPTKRSIELTELHGAALNFHSMLRFTLFLEFKAQDSSCGSQGVCRCDLLLHSSLWPLGVEQARRIFPARCPSN